MNEFLAILIVLVMNTAMCAVLAIPVVLLVRSIQKRRQDHVAGKPSKEQIKQRQEDMAAFNNTNHMLSEGELANRPIPATLGKLLGGGLVVCVTTFIGAFIPLGSSGESFRNASFIGCFVGLWLVDKLLLGESDPLDKRRWQHFWHGDLAGYWPCYLVLLFTLKDELAAYVAAWFIGFGVGLLNVWRCDAADKRQVVALFQEWRQPQTNV